VVGEDHCLLTPCACWDEEDDNVVEKKSEKVRAGSVGLGRKRGEGDGPPWKRKKPEWGCGLLEELGFDFSFKNFSPLFYVFEICFSRQI
jgi:hypothetical protein